VSRTAGSVPGLVFALPNAQVLVEASRTLVTAKMVADAEKAAKAASDALAEAGKAKQASAAALKEAQAQLAVGGASIKDGLIKKRDLADAIARLREAQAEAAAVASEEAKKRFEEIKGKTGELEQVVTVKPLAPAPDRTARYVAVLNESWTRDDTVKITTDNGMLATTSSESTGQLGAILVNLASAVAGFGTMKSGPFETAQAPESCGPFKYSATFDPTNLAESNAVRAELLQTSQRTLTLETELLKASDEMREAGLKIQGGASVAGPGDPRGDSKEPPHRDGLYYRALVSTTITVREKSSDACSVEGPAAFARLTTTVPDASGLFLLPLKAGQFTRSKLDFEFKNGSPTSFRSEQQSQLNAIARIPVDMLKAIVEVPASILKLRVDYQSQNTALIEAQSKQLLAEVEVLKAQKALEDERLKQAKPSSP
jgi:hypothetical protein